ncbi:Group 4 capsule polysaccharide lipoprotein gfcB, YjbF [Roseovarius nanhaiticus]|uniref:Group 4 capsule polysaccharide lipoprotein gfcB, YjbF n=1 Tax=Roseovarius nanhaiticus TaxID=573024 RepID=A0A1N7EPM3_9RHOB|nr:YjbF family lipoprotein [Roseovarius nanhaiticus]SEK69895.1 Group 4 capsule polysaccharide lipoprotein gfcB, YjbF [Roseovarius nanhaiticus]SIR89992.1 Group 4 capsule polysaccharide lipoprotein gfcB, YjbF [Roseovarius nanhaiticus]
MIRLTRIALLLAFGFGLSGCGNAPGRDVTAVSIVQNIVSAITGSGTADTPDANAVARQAAAALTNTDGQVVVLAIPNRDVLTALQEIERNGDYVTFGSADRRSLTLKHGMLTATRGLGYDLMSADVEQVYRLIRTRTEGAAPRVNRYLDGENQTRPLSVWCQIKQGNSSASSAAGLPAGTVGMLESCVSDGATFQNSYQVTPDGRIVQSRQWISPLNGYVTVQSLR